MTYAPQKITKAVLRRLAKAEPPDKPREIRDRSRGIVLRHQPSGYMAIYAQLGRGKRERLCNARDILDDHNPLTLSAVFEQSKVLHGEAATGRDFAGERNGGATTLAEFPVLAACGGFSYGDVLGGGGGWAKSILFHEATREQFLAFFAADTLTLGVCNGCQMLANLGELIPDAGPGDTRPYPRGRSAYA